MSRKMNEYLLQWATAVALSTSVGCVWVLTTPLAGTMYGFALTIGMMLENGKVSGNDQ